MKNWNSWQTWFKIILVILAIIFMLVGFLAGYFYGDKDCIENPLAYGIKQLNEANNDQFVCSCNSNLGKQISIDDGGLFNSNIFSSTYILQP